MIVSHDLKLLFAHVPKAAGSSITAALRPWLSCRSTDPLPVDTKHWQQQWHGIGALHGPCPPAAERLVRDGYRMVAVVRNPFWRLASWCKISGEDIARSAPHMRRPVSYFAGPWLEDSGVLRFDHLDDDWAFLCEDLEIEAPLPHANRKPSPVSEAEVRSFFASNGNRRLALGWFVDDVTRWGFKIP